MTEAEAQPPSPPATPLPEDPARLRDAAWIGDAVLGLYVRRFLLDPASQMPREARNGLYQHFTGNAFLSAVGEPTQVEARIGQLFETQGLEAAFDWIETTLQPLFLRQYQNQRRGGAQRGSAAGKRQRR